MSKQYHFPVIKVQGCGLPISVIERSLQNSYLHSSEQSQNISGFQRDNDLSIDKAQVYYNPGTKQTLVVHRGTNSTATDWSNNVAYLTGMYKLTNRYKTAKRTQEAAEKKYGTENLYTIGHSQGSLLAAEVGKNSKQIIAVDRALSPSDAIFKKAPANLFDLRTTNDAVSAFVPLQRREDNGTLQTIHSNSFDPIKEHDLGQLEKLGNDTVIGGKLFFPKKSSFSPPRKRVSLQIPSP